MRPTASGVLGKTGRGVQEHFGLPPDAIDVKMGTLSKGLASQGGFVAAQGRDRHVPEVQCPRLCLQHRPAGAEHRRGCQGVGDPPAASPQRVERLRRNAARLLDGLRAVGLKTTQTETPIIPVLCETMEKTLAMTAACRRVRPVRRPGLLSRGADEFAHESAST